MKDRSIIFQGWGVRAILDGRKTQTRRVIKPQPTGSTTWLPHYEGIHHMGFYPNNYDATPSHLKCPYGQPGDRLWVRETFMQDQYDNVFYKADYPELELHKPECEREWKPSIHMPRWASRITLEVVDVRVERVQDITEEDAKAEGVTPDIIDDRCPPSHLNAFVNRWTEIHGIGDKGFSANPWCWGISFKVLR